MINSSLKNHITLKSIANEFNYHKQNDKNSLMNHFVGIFPKLVCIKDLLILMLGKVHFHSTIRSLLQSTHIPILYLTQ